MTYQLSFFHLGIVTVKDTEPHITGLYSLLEVPCLPSSLPSVSLISLVNLQVLQSEVTSLNTQQRTKTTSLLEEVLLSRARDLVQFHARDLHLTPDMARANIRSALPTHLPPVTLLTALVPPVSI